MDQLTDQTYRLGIGDDSGTDISQSSSATTRILAPLQVVGPVSVYPRAKIFDYTSNATDSSPPQAIDNTCTVCASPATVFCKTCQHVTLKPLDFDKPRFYCSKECQVTDWPKHKDTCLAIQQALDYHSLTSAAYLLDAAFHAFRLDVWDLSVKDLGFINGVLMVEEGEYDTDQVLVKYPSELVEVKIPEDFLPRVTDMLLRMMACSDTMNHFYNLCKMLLIDTRVAQNIEELCVEPRAGRSSWMLQRRNGVWQCSEDFPHAVYRVTLKNGARYALDLSAAQFGWEKILVEWPRYMRQRVANVHEVDPFGTEYARFRSTGRPTYGQSSTSDDIFMMKLLQWAQHDISSAMELGISRGLREEKKDLRAILNTSSFEDIHDITSRLLTWQTDYVKCYMGVVASRGGFVQGWRPQNIELYVQEWLDDDEYMEDTVPLVRVTGLYDAGPYRVRRGTLA